MTVSALISQRMIELAWTQRDVAEAMARQGATVTPQSVSNWLRGVSRPSPGNFVALCAALGLFGDEETQARRVYFNEVAA